MLGVAVNPSTNYGGIFPAGKWVSAKTVIHFSRGMPAPSLAADH